MEKFSNYNLVICNPQNDFITEVKSEINSINKFDNIIELINQNDFNKIIIPIKSYPVDSKVFKHPSDTRYCIKYTDGGAINKRLLDNLSTYKTIVSGEINDYIEDSSFAYSCFIDNRFVLRSSTDYVVCNTTNFVICGFNDNLVIESIKSLLLTIPKENIKVFLNGTNNTDNKLAEFCNSNNIEIL